MSFESSNGGHFVLLQYYFIVELFFSLHLVKTLLILVLFFFYSFIDRQGGLVFSACRVREIAYGLYDPSEEKCQSFFYCKIPILCQSLATICQILLVISDRTDEFDELCNSVLVKSTKNV